MPGGLTTRELGRATRRITAELPVCAIELVEVAPAYDPSGNITAIAANNLVLEALSGLALQRSGAGEAGARRAPAVVGATCRSFVLRYLSVVSKRRYLLRASTIRSPGSDG